METAAVIISMHTVDLLTRQADLSHAVINGASDLFVKLYGERGRHARAAFAVAGLPLNATAEIQVTILFE